MRVRRRMLSGGFGTAASLLVALAIAPLSQANIGYEPDATKPVIPLSVDLPGGIAIDQSTRQIYVAGYLKTVTMSPPLHGEILQLEADGTPTANSPIGAGQNHLFGGVAVNPVTHGIYGSRTRGEIPTGSFGEPKIHAFSSTGAELSSFTPNNNAPTVPHIAADSSGRVYYPNPTTGLVEVFNATGVLQTTISCAGCPDGTFAEPAGVAIDSADNVYVVDTVKDFVVKLKPASQSFAFERRFQSGVKAGSVAVNSVTGDVFVGGRPSGGFHIVAYDSGGVAFDDFAAGMFFEPPQEAGMWFTPQMAVDETTGDLVVGDKERLVVFERTTIASPTATIGLASQVAQLKATLNANVNANGHGVFDCHFEYVKHADFLVNGFTGAPSPPCLTKPAGTSTLPISLGLTGLTPGVTYHFRVVAESHGGETPSGAQTFATLPATPPQITPQPATNVSQTNAFLAAKVNPKGGTVSACHFEYGTSTAYGSQVPCSSLPGEVSTDVALTRGVTGLTAGTTYHFRLVVTSNAGTTKGTDGQFTTTAEPTQPTTPTTPSDGSSTGTPPPVVTPTPARKPLRCKKGFVKKKVRGKPRCVKKPRKRAARKRSSAR
jgi:hypothetical protein